jgi:RNA polymerase sigma factor (TIGR02999 family)
MTAGEFTQAVARFRAGDAGAQDEMIGMIYGELRELARRHLSLSRRQGTLDTAGLVNESYLRLVSPSAQHVETRAHFLNLASRIMRQVLCDFARKRLRQRKVFEKRDELPEVADDSERELLEQALELLKLDAALQELSGVSERQVKVVECRFFSGLSEDETAAALRVSLRTVQREWQAARSWLKAWMKREH